MLLHRALAGILLAAALSVAPQATAEPPSVTSRVADRLAGRATSGNC